MGPFHEKDWIVDRKASQELRASYGDIKNYDNWCKRIRDHFIGANMYYKDVFDIIEREKNVISWNALSMTKNPRLPNLNWH